MDEGRPFERAGRSPDELCRIRGEEREGGADGDQPAPVAPIQGLFVDRLDQFEAHLGGAGHQGRLGGLDQPVVA